MCALRVLFVDDEEELVSAVVERLQLRGIEETTYDVIAVDVKMPGLGGLEVVQRVKERHPELQMILLSGHGSRDDAEEGRRLGAFDYVEKPINIDIFIDILRKAAGSVKSVTR